MKSGTDLARELVQKAANDLAAAMIGVSHGAPMDTVCFHVQQAAEKLLKALLSAIDIPYPRTHDLDQLFDLALPQYPDLAPFVERFETFGPYAVALRYSNDFQPSDEEVARGLEAVKDFESLVRDLLRPAICATSEERGTQ